MVSVPSFIVLCLVCAVAAALIRQVVGRADLRVIECAVKSHASRCLERLRAAALFPTG